MVNAVEIGSGKAAVIDIDYCSPEAAAFVRRGAPLLQTNNDVVAVACWKKGRRRRDKLIVPFSLVSRIFCNLELVSHLGRIICRSFFGFPIDGGKVQYPLPNPVLCLGQAQIKAQGGEVRFVDEEN